MHTKQEFEATDLFLFSLDPENIRRNAGVPHPLARFGLNGGCQDNPYANFILQFVQDLALSEPDSRRHKIAKWFLLESGKTFFFTCAEAGIDGDKLREHLKICRALTT